MTLRVHLAAVLVASLLISGYAGMAQEEEFVGEFEVLPDKKTPGLFMHRPDKDTPEAQLTYANQLLEGGKKKKAMKQYRALVHEWHEAPEAAQAQKSYASLLEQKNKYIKAFDEYQYLIDHFTGQVSHKEVLDRQFRLANHEMTRRRCKIFFMPGYTAPEAALPLFTKIVANGPNWEKAPQSQFYIGLIHEQSEGYEDAVDAYEVVATRYKDSEFGSDAAFRRANCLFLMANRATRDEGSCNRALSALASFIADYAGDPDIKEAKENLETLKVRLAGIYYEKAMFYDLVQKRPESAIIAYTDFIKRFPLSERSDEAAERIAELKILIESSKKDDSENS